MNAERETGMLSLAFVTGIIIAAIFRHGCGASSGAEAVWKLRLTGSSGITAAAASMAGASICLAVCILKSGRCRLWIILMYVSIGAMCGFTDSLSGLCHTGQEMAGQYASTALEAFKRLIERCGFEGEHTTALLKALLTGCRDELETGTVQAFRKSGASHILALSGLHLGVIYTILTKAMSFSGSSPAARTVRSALIVACCLFYTMMTGASDSTVRAFIFITVNEIIRSESCRMKSPICTLSVALTLQLVFKPSAIGSVGFQLSYLAMLGILTVYPGLEKWYPSGGSAALNRFDPMHRIWSSMTLSLSCQLFTAPVAWWHFHSFPVHFLLTNLIALPLTEVLITAAVTALALTAADICPEFLIDATDGIAAALEFCISTIASM